MEMGTSYLKTPPLKFVNFLSPSIMATPKFVFIMSFTGWMRKNQLTEVSIEEFNSKLQPGKKTRLIRGDEETIFLSRKLFDKELDPANLQIVEVNDENLCLCNKNTGEIVGTLKVS
jgi:hypothetical protein